MSNKPCILLEETTERTAGVAVSRGDPMAIKTHYRRSDEDRRPVCGARSTNMTIGTTKKADVDCLRCLAWLANRGSEAKVQP